MFDKDKVWLGITPTGWTNDDMPTLGDENQFERIVSEMALAGFQGCSVGHKFPTDTKVLKRELDLRGLRVSEPWVSTLFTVKEMEERTLDYFKQQTAFIKEMGGTDIVVAELGHAVHQQPVAVLPNKPVFDDDQWKAMVEGLERLGRMAAEEGMRLCYHHHMGTGVQSRADVDRLLTATDPSVVHLLLDCAHLTWAGDDPLELAHAHIDRIRHVHLKSVRAHVIREATDNRWSFFQGVLAGAFTVPGDGDIDFRPILEVLASHGYEGWLSVEAEQDPTKANPLEQALMARSYLREVLGF